MVFWLTLSPSRIVAGRRTSKESKQHVYDAIIVGGGPAGLSAALILGRCRRRVLLCDTGRPRNARSKALHGFLTRDGIEPAELLRISREQLAPYTSVELREAEVRDARQGDGRFEALLDDGSWQAARMLLLATGVIDELPQMEGVEEMYGHSVFHCPYCDGWEVRDQPLAIYAREGKGLGTAMELTVWSRDLVLCTDGPVDLSAENRRQLDRYEIPVREEAIVRLEGSEGILEKIVFAKGPPLRRRAMFFSTGYRQHSDLPARFGCDFTEQGAVNTGRYETTHCAGLFVVGDASRDAQLAIIAAAEGAKAAFAINTALWKADTSKERFL